MSQEKLSLSGIHYYYNGFKALDDVSFSLRENQIMGLIGRNGSGKTTLLKVIANQLLPNQGTVRIEGTSFQDAPSMTRKICLARETLGKTFEQGEVMKVRQVLDIAGTLYENWDAEYATRLIKRFRIDVKKKYPKLSKGMKTTLGIILGLASRAEITLFDEPYIGLDPVAREIFYEELQKDYNTSPRTIIFSSHLINELEGLFERVLIIDEGKTIVNSDVQELKNRYYLIQGRREDIERHAAKFRTMSVETIGALASYSVEAHLDEQTIRDMEKDDIRVSRISLQKLLYHLTERTVNYKTKAGESNEG